MGRHWIFPSQLTLASWIFLKVLTIIVFICDTPCCLFSLVNFCSRFHSHHVNIHCLPYFHILINNVHHFLTNAVDVLLFLEVMAEVSELDELRLGCSFSPIMLTQPPGVIENTLTP